jgi:hypothetical protein
VKGWVNSSRYFWVKYTSLLIDPQEQVAQILHIYNLCLRVLTITMISQYLFHDRYQVADPYLDSLLEEKLPHLTPDSWEGMLFTSLRAYEGNHDLFFMPELYDFYWDTSTFPHRKRSEVKGIFDRLTQATIEFQTKRLECTSK